MKEKIIHILSKILQCIRYVRQRIPLSTFIQTTKQYIFKYYQWIATLLIALLLADLSILFLWPQLLPGKSLSVKTKPTAFSRKTTQPAKADFIHSINIFHRGKIPLSMHSEKQNITTLNQTAQASTLPFTLLGTIENTNSELSMATILDSFVKQSGSYFIGDTINDKARITAIERRKVTFINLTNNRSEYIEIPTEKNTPLSMQNYTPTRLFPEKNKETPLTQHEGINPLGGNQFAVKRSAINSHLKNLPDILQQARMDPKFNSDGDVLGHTFTWIKKGSVFESLGFQTGDTLLSVNGEKINDAAEASALMQQFRTRSDLTAEVQSKDGKSRTISYSITEDSSIE